MLQRNRDRIRATADYTDAVLNSDTTFIIVPTPSDADGRFSLKYLLIAVEQIGAVLRQKEGFHLVVITSTVMPGATGGEILPTLEAASGKRCGEGFGLCYSPEFIALGNVIHDMLNPDFILIGESDPRSGEMLATIYRQLSGNKAPISHMNLVNAELAKISVNTFVTTKISYANMLSEICEQIPGADVDVVTNAIGQDSRIGKKYLRGATGYGGPCFPRDNVAFGLGIALASELLSKGFAIILYDALALEDTRQILGDQPHYASSAQECVAQADVVVITTPSPEFKALKPGDFVPASGGGKKLLLDCWRILERSELAPVCDYLALGVGEPTAGK